MIKQLPRILVVVSIAALALLPWLSVGADSSGDWTQYLGSSARTGFNAAETLITPANASQLQLQWNAKAGSLISAQPVASQGQIFWGSWDGYERSTNLDGTLNWQTYLGQSSDVCDTPRYGVTDSPVVSTISVNGTPTRVLIVGGGDDNEYALNAATGTVIWKTALSPNAGSFTWSSPTLYNGSVYVGVSSINDCPQVAGRLVKLDATTGTIQAVFNTVPQPPNVCTGGSIWTSPTIDTNTGIVYLAVGDTSDCNDSSGNHIYEPLTQALVEVQASDLSLVNHWQVPYSSTIGDGDMTTTPTLFTATLNGVTKQMVGLFNKNGSYYAFDTTSDIHSVGPVWTSQIAQTGQPDDGVSSVSSSAWDGQKLYLAGGATTIGGASCTGSVRAVNPSTGAFLWQDCLNTGEASAPVYGAVMASPGIVVVADGDMLRVLAASDGTQLFSYTDTSADFNGPATISNGVIYIGDEAGNLLASAPSTTTPTVTPTSTPTSTNLVQNGSFDSGTLRPWSLVLHTGGNGSAALDGSTFVSSRDSAAITVTQANMVPWYVQLAQGQIPLTGNQQYTLSFSAKASVNRNVNVVLQQDHSPWSEYFNHDFAVTQSWQRYTLTFTPQTSDISTMLDFNLAQTAGQVWLDNVDVEGPGAPTPNPTSSPTPNPTSSPTPNPTSSPTPNPTSSPTPNPTSSPTPNPTSSPTPNPTSSPTPTPTSSPTPTATPTSTVSPTATVTPTPTGTPSNLLTNGSFDGSSLSPWGVTQHTGARGSAAQDSSTFVSSPDSAKVSITQANSVPWYLQFGQGGVHLTAGTPYTVSFSAKASQQRNLNVVVQQNHTPWTEFTNHNVALTLAWQQYSFVFTPSSAESNAILQFNVAGATGQVWLDNASVSSGSGSASLPARIEGSPGRIVRNKLPRFPT